MSVFRSRQITACVWNTGISAKTLPGESEDKMSFSGEIKEELSTLVPAAHHCRLAETAAILLFCGKIILTEIPAV